MASISDMQPVASAWPRLLSAMPDALTAAGCMVVWIAPFVLGADAVKTVLLMMLMEFILMHATGFFTAIAAPADAPKAGRIAKLCGLAMIYLLFVVAWAWVFRAWWPLGVFAWMLVGKVGWIYADPRGRADEVARQMMAWGFSLVAYIGAVFAGLMLPLPTLGLDAVTVASLHLPASGAWIDHPHVAVGSAVLYYTALAVFKGWGGSVPVATSEVT